MCKFYGVYTIQENPAPTTKDTERGVIIKVRASTRVSRSFKTFDRDGKEVESSYTSDFLSIFINKRKSDGAVPKIANDIATPGNQFFCEGELYQVRSKEGKYFTRMEVRDVQYVGFKDGTKSFGGGKGSSYSSSSTGKRPDSQAPAAQPVHAGVDNDEDIPF